MRQGLDSWVIVYNLALAGVHSPNPMERAAFETIRAIADDWIKELTAPEETAPDPSAT